MPPSTQPSNVTTGQPTPAGLPLQYVNWSAVSYPLDCAGVGYGAGATYVTPQAGIQLALVLVSCKFGAGTPPSALLVYDRATSATTPHLLQILISDKDYWLANNVSGEGAHVSMKVAGYSSRSVVRASPDVTATFSWDWAGGMYHATSTPPPHELLPRTS